MAVDAYLQIEGIKRESQDSVRGRKYHKLYENLK